jgi:hypothetical protein
MLNTMLHLFCVSTHIIEGEAPGILRAYICEEESTWSGDKYWWQNPKILGLERHLDGRKQVVEKPLRTETNTNFSNKYTENLERSLFGEDVKLKVFEKHPNSFLEVEFDEVFYHVLVERETNIVNLYHKIKQHHFSE